MKISQESKNFTLNYLSIIALAAVVLLSFQQAGHAAQGGFSDPAAASARGGFSGPGPEVTTVKEASSMRDDARVMLRGNIIQHLGGDDYLFKDATGTITVDIDDKRWRGQEVTPKDTVEIYGEVDRDFTKVEIDVKSITKK